MAKRAAARDVYLNFFTLEVTSDAADATALEQSAQNTSAGVATNFAWRIHLLEWYPHADFEGTNVLTVALSTRKSLAAMPSLNDKGCVGIIKLYHDESAAGMADQFMPQQQVYLPPMLIASPSLSLYCQATQNNAAQRGVAHRCRIGFTMVELDSAAYNELWQTWNFAD
jgi:hypothetical protein